MRRKKQCVFLCFMLFLIIFITACSQNSIETEAIPETSEIKNDDEEVEITQKDNKIVIRIYENQALSLRYRQSVSGNALKLVSEETKEGDNLSIATGDSPAYHIFQYEGVGDGNAVIKLEEYWLNADVKEDEVNETILYDVLIEDGEISICPKEEIIEPETIINESELKEENKEKNALRNKYKVESKLDGKELSVEPGYTAVRMITEKYIDSNAGLILPDLSAWGGKSFEGSAPSVKEDSGANKIVYNCTDADRKELNNYISLLQEKYQFQIQDLGDFTGSSYYSHTWVGNYTGENNISKNLAYDSRCGSCDILIFSYSSISSTFVSIEYPPEIGFGDTGDRKDGSIVSPQTVTEYENKNAASYSVNENGTDTYRINGISEENGAYLELQFLEGTYQRGDIYQKEDFASQVSSGKSALRRCILCSKEIEESEIGYTWEPDADHEAYFETIQAEILENSEAGKVIYYLIVIKNAGGTRYSLEGLLAVTTDSEKEQLSEKETSSSSSGSDSYSYKEDNKTTLTCTRCQGKGEIDCSSCSGHGAKSCTHCGGDGEVYDSLNGEDAVCSSCYGTGKQSCNKCMGTGKMTCPSCGGDGDL